MTPELVLWRWSLRAAVILAVVVLMFFAGAALTRSVPPVCRGCAVLAPGVVCPGGGEAVVGGEVC